MYLNFKLIKAKKIKARDLLTIQAIKQKEYEMFKSSVAYLEKLEKDGWLKKIKGTKKMEVYLKFRLTDKAKRFLKTIEIVKASPNSIKLSKLLRQAYEDNNLEKKKGNEKKVNEMIAWFLMETQYKPSIVLEKVNDYLSETESEYTKTLENLICYNVSHFVTKWDLRDSMLYTLMEN